MAWNPDRMVKPHERATMTVLPKTSAIYRILCTLTGAAYIGCSENVQKRWREHRSTARRGIHQTKLFQEEWNLYGEDAFVVEILEEMPRGLSIPEKRERETYWFSAHPGRLLCNPECSYGGTPEAIKAAIEASRHVTGRKWTPEANLKRSLAQKGKSKGHGAKISATKQAQRLARLNQSSMM